jgi:hypothetical protein
MFHINVPPPSSDGSEGGDNVLPKCWLPSTQLHSPEYHDQQLHHHENLESYMHLICTIYAMNCKFIFLYILQKEGHSVTCRLLGANS